MAAPLVQRVTLDAASAQAQLAQLERQLATLNNPINVPVDIDVDGTQRAERQMEGLRREVDQTGDEFAELGRKADASTDGILRVGTRGASAFTSLRGSILGVGAAIAAIQGVRLLGGFAADAIESASNLEESLSKTNVVFGQLSSGIQRFAAEGPRALGLSTAAALEATSTFGNLFLALGLTREAAADLAPDIVQLAADLASFNNIDVSEAVEKLRSGLVGEVEPLRTLGVNLNAATVEAKAFALGFVDANGAVTEAGKVQARYALILEQTTTAQGDFARTADGIANSQRTLAAQFEDAKTAIGEALIPAFKTLLELAPQLIDGLKDLAPTIQAIASTMASADFTTFATGLVDISRALVNIPGVLAGIKDDWFDVGMGNQTLVLSRHTQELVEQLREGVDPAKALANGLASLANTDLNPQQLREAASALVAITGLDPARLVDLSRTLATLGPDLGLDAADIKIIRQEIAKLLSGDVLSPEALRTIPPAINDTVDAIRTEAEALEVLDRAADEAGVTTRHLLADQSALSPELQATAAMLSASTLKYLEQVDAIDALSFQIEALPGAMDAAQAALKDSEGEIVSDFSDFFANLQEELAKREAFESNLAILRALGLDNLAQVFDEAGLEAAGALADAVSNPREAQNAEAALKGTATDQANAYIGAFEEAIAGLPVTQGLIDNIIQAAAEADSPEVQQALLALAEALQLQIPVTFDTTNLGNFTIPEAVLRLITPDQSTRGDAGRSGPASVSVEQNFFTEPAQTTTTQRAAQEIQSIVAGTRS